MKIAIEIILAVVPFIGFVGWWRESCRRRTAEMQLRIERIETSNYAERVVECFDRMKFIVWLLYGCIVAMVLWFYLKWRNK